MVTVLNIQTFVYVLYISHKNQITTMMLTSVKLIQLTMATLIVCFCSAFNHRSSSFIYSKKRLKPLRSSTSNNEPKIKLPILQVYNQKELVSEFIVGNDFEGSMSKFQSFISSYSKEMLAQSNGEKLNYMSWPIENVYAESTLDAFLSMDRLVVLKIYRDQCKQCQKLEPIYFDFAKSQEMSHFRWIQADVENLPLFKSKLKTRLSGNSDNSGKDCETCCNTGFVSCNNCKNSGIVARGTLTVICPVCMGTSFTIYFHEKQGNIIISF